MFALLGMFIMIPGQQLPGHLPGLELLTLSSYAPGGLARDNATATEAAMKYPVLAPWPAVFALWPVHALWRHRFFDIGQVFKAVLSVRSSTRCWYLVWCLVGWLGLAGCGFPPHVGFLMCTSRCSHRHHTDDR